MEYIRAQRVHHMLVARFERFIANWGVIVKTLWAGIYEERSPLWMALAYEQVTDWHKQNPTQFA